MDGPPVREICAGDDNYPETVRFWFPRRVPDKLYVMGKMGVLAFPRFGLLASRQANPACLLRAYEMLDDLAGRDVCVLGGWHSALEVEMLDRLFRGKAKVVALCAKGIQHYEAPDHVRQGLADGRSLILTHCTPRVARPGRDAAVRRNRLLAALSHALFVPCASARSATAKLVAEAAANGMPVATVDHEHNEHLVHVGATPCDGATFAAWIEEVLKRAKGGPSPPLPLL